MSKWTTNFQVPEADFVAPAKKVLPYTVTPIGGPDDLKKWKAEQLILLEARRIAHAKAYGERRLTAIKMIEEQTHTLTFTDVERAEAELRPSGEAPKAAPKATVYTPPVYEETPKEPFKFTKWVAKVFKAGFPD